MHHGKEEGGGKREERLFKWPLARRFRVVPRSKHWHLSSTGSSARRSKNMVFHPRSKKEFFAQSQRRSNIKQASVELLGQIRPLSDLLTTWFEEAPYVDSVGAPRVLKIEGHGATFETLAKRFLPGVPLADVVALACRTANVGTLPGGRIALYGDAMVNL